MLSKLCIQRYVPISFRRDRFASLRASLTIDIISLEWCSAVYLGRKPVPGGVTNVLRGLDKIFPEKSTIPVMVRCVPTPTLLALPSIPRTYLGFSSSIYLLDIKESLLLIKANRSRGHELCFINEGKNERENILIFVHWAKQQQQKMKRVLLFEKIQNIKTASKFEHKLIDSIFSVMQMKRQADHEYKKNLELVNQQLERYIVQQNGFLTDIIKAFQSYVTVIHQNMSTLIEGYDHEILNFLVKAKQSSMEEELIRNVKFFDEKITECQDKILSLKKSIKDTESELQIIAHEVKLNSKIGTITDDDKKKYAQKFQDLSTLKQLHEDKLEAEVDGMMELTMTHNTILKTLDEYQTIYLERKGADVFDNFMRAFVLEVSFIRSMQFDVGTILQKVKDKQEQHKKVALEALKIRMRKETSSVTVFLKDTYKKLTNNFILEINEPYINQRIKNKWGTICDYYNSAA